MKILLSSTLILLALYAQASCASDQLSRFIVLSSNYTSDSGQHTSVKPTLYIPLQNSNQGIVFFRSLNRSQTVSQSGIERSSHSQHYGLGLHQQINAWMYTQVVLQSQHYSQQQGAYESLFNVSMSF
jgi:hypothetical protein